MRASHLRKVPFGAATVMISITLVATAQAADWMRAGITTNQPIWGLRGGLQFAIPPGGFTWGDGGPRGLIRVGYPTLPHDAYDLINFIAIEPVVKGQRGLSELERSSIDGKPGKRFSTSNVLSTAAPLNPGQISLLTNGVEQLTVPLFVEKFDNGAHVRLTLTQRSDAPDEVTITVHAERDSAKMERCILTATMGNKARTRLLWLKDGPVSSLDIYGGYRGAAFTEHELFALDRLPRTSSKDVLVAVTTDESTPGNVRDGLSRFWQYRGEKVTQYWRKPSVELSEDLRCVVNGRLKYWMSSTSIPGGIAYENFELQQAFRDGQQFTFGISKRSPRELLK